METWNRLTVAIGGGEGDNGGKKEKGLTSQVIYINDPWTWTMALGLTLGAGGGLSGRRQSGGNWDNYNRITFKNFRKISKKK